MILFLEAWGQLLIRAGGRISPLERASLLRRGDNREQLWCPGSEELCDVSL